MNLNEYQFNASNYAIYPHVGRGTVEEGMYLALGLTGEAGEVAEKLKKFYRDGTYTSEDFAKELGDVLWYLSQLAKWADYPLDSIANINLTKLESRANRGVLQGSGDNR